MAEFILGRIKFVYRNNWAPAIAYVVDDVVTRGGKTYICIKNHTSSTDFMTDYDPNPAISNWNLLADGQQWKGDWTAVTEYNSGDLVKYGGIVYQCTLPHESATYTSPTWLGLEEDLDKWELFASSFDWKDAWTTSTRYKVNDIVSYNGYTYVCNTKHISAATESLGLEDDLAKWDVFNSGIKYLGSWEDLGASYRYKKNDLVKYGADLWICTDPHTSTANFSDGNWAIFLNGFEFENSWSGSTTYQIGDIVTYGGYSYVAKQNHTNKKPSAEPAYWDVYTTGFTFQGDWINTTSYKIGSVIRHHGYTYLSNIDSPSISTTATATTVSTDPTFPNTITADTTGFVAGMAVYFGTSFGGLVANTKYYILSAGLTATRFKVSTTPNGSPVTLTTTTGQNVSVIATADPINTTYWSKLNSGFKWTNNPTTYTAVAGVAQGSSLGVSATFNVTRTGTIYTVSVNAGGSFFVLGDTLKIVGTSLGGLSPVNDLTLTVTGVSSGAITSVTTSGISVTWTSGVVYVLGDVVFFGANSYTCVQEHVASTGTRPDNDTSATYWNLLTAGAEVANLTTAGDTLYYSPIGPSRLPIGANGQVLRVKDGYPSWETYGHIFNAVFVGPTGSDLPYPQSGFSIDQPWKTIRYACKQIEEGYRNPQAKHLLQTNKLFLVKEVNNYIQYTYKASVTGTSGGGFTTTNTAGLTTNMPITFTSQTGSLTINGNSIPTTTTYYVKTIVTNTSFTVSLTPEGATAVAAGTGTAVAKFSYDSSKAERDAGLIVEGLIYDLSKGGTYKTTTNTLSFYDSTGTAYITANTGYQINQFIGSHRYLKTIVSNILNNTAPVSNYQTLNGATDTIGQIINTEYTAEEGAVTTVQSLLDILINGLTRGDTSTTPTAIAPNTTISVKTGTYQEVLPIVVPEYTAIVGDELRSTVVQPKTANSNLVNDKSKTISALNRIKAIVPTVISNGSVTPTTGNTEIQITTLSAGSAGSTTAVSRAVSAGNTIYDIVNTGFGAVPSFQFSTPTGYNTASLTNTAYASTGYPTGNTSNFGDGKAQIVQNYDFIVADVLQYYANGSYSSVWNATSTEGRDKGKRDIKYILDAIQHDMTYGGNYQASIAGSAYYSSYLLNISDAEKPAFIDLFGFMKTLIGKIVRKDAITAQSGNTVTRVTTGTAGSAAAGAFAEDRVQNVIDWITNGVAPTAVAPYYGWADSALQTAYSDIQGKRSEIVLDARAWVQKYYQDVVLDLTLTERDAGLLADAIAYDIVLGTNFNSLSAGRAYLRGTASTTVLLNSNEKNPTLGAIKFIKNKIKTIAGAGASARAQTLLDDAVGFIKEGATRRIDYSLPNLPAGSYSAVSGTNISGTGSSATFNFVRTAAGFTASIASGGTGYNAGNTIKILGSNIGGATPANDIVITVNTVSTGTITSISVSTFNDAVILLEDNRNFIIEEAVAYVTFTYPSLVYDKDLTRRDAGYILDALHYDLIYGGDFASQQAGQAYYSFGTSQISAYVKTATLDAINRISTVAQAVVQNNLVSATSGNTQSQVFKNGAQTAGSSLAATTISSLVTKIYNYANSGLTSGAPTITITTVATGDTFTSNGHGLANGDLVEPQTTPTVGQGGYGLVADTTYYVVSASTNTFKLASTYNGAAITTFTNGTGLSLVVHKTNMPYIGWADTDLIQQYSNLSGARATLQADTVTYIDDNYPNLTYDSALASRDAGLAIDAASLDLVLGTNFRGVKAGQSYNRPQSINLKKSTLYSATRESLKYLLEQVLDTISTNSTAVTRAKESLLDIINQLDKGVGEPPEINGTVTYKIDTGIVKGAEILRANLDFLAAEATAWVDDAFGGYVTSTTTTTNILTTSSAHNLSVGDPVKFTFTEYNLVATASSASTDRFVLNSTSGLVVGMPVVFSGTLFGGVTGLSPYYIASIVGNEISVSSTNGGGTYQLSDGTGIMQVTAGGVYGGVSVDTTYYVLTTPSITTLTITDSQEGTSSINLVSAIGYMKIGYAYDADSCKRDLREFVNAIIYDLQYTGNYKTKRAAELYVNAVDGSSKSDMWHVRNGTGIRNMTMNGISGTLSILNEYGTRRPEAGSYTSLDPGFGPYDTNAWVFNRSCYVQNCTLFGNGATALKIDGALHAGGNRSIVANDYTTFISDGIGTWCTGSNSLTELVSVFAYYSYAGYLAELGGKIRATNGNSSYGTYGVIAEGVDSYETPLYGTLNNRAAEAQVTNVLTDGAEEVLRIEFSNAGMNYTNAEWTISGAGYNATAVGDEFRDYGVMETRLIDLNDGYGYGGSGYLTAANAAQLSTVGTIVLAASDTQLSTAYIGMRVLITAGTGAGQSAAILTYNSGSKEAKIFKESFTPVTVTATSTTNNLLTVSSTATLYVGMPIYLSGSMSGTGGATGLSANTLYYVIAANFSATQFAVSTSLGGSAVTISNNVTGLSIALYEAGWDHVVPGKTVYNSLDLTTTYIVEPRITYTAPGYTATARTLASSATWQAVTYAAGRFIAIPSGSAATTTSTNGTTWSAAGNLPSSTTWVDVAYGGGEGATATAVVGGLGGIGASLEAVLENGQVVAVNILSGGFGYLTPPTIKFSSGLAAATARVLNGEIVEVNVTIPGSGYSSPPTVTARTDIITSFTINTAGKNYTSAPTVTVSGGGSTNQATGTAVLNTNGGVSSITVGNGGGTGYTSQPTVTIVDANAKYIAIPSTASGGTTKVAYQTAAGAGSASAWTASTGSLPNGSYAAITYGAGYWVAVGGSATATRSADGNTTWSSITIPTLGAGTYSGVAYGHGVFVAVATGTNSTAVSTTSGSSWSAGGTLPASANWSSVAYGNGRFVAIASGSNRAAVSVDKGTTWVASNAGLPASATWTKVAYGQGLFFATASGTTTCATSPNGLTWTLRTMPSTSNWKSVAFGNPSNNPIFAAISSTSGTVAASIITGATAQGRAKVASNQITEIRMIDPGSGYPRGTITATTASTNIITTADTTNLVNLQPVEFTGLDAYGLTTGVTYYVTTGTIVSNTSFKVSADTTLAAAGTPVTLTTGTGLSGTYTAAPIVTQTDPNKIRTAPVRSRIATGVLGNPGFTNRGNANTTATATVTGDGFSDLYQASNFINVAGLFETPKAGSNVEFASIPNTWYKLVAVTNKLLASDGTYTATFQINPALSVLLAPSHNDRITTRLKYSQVRLTGHDFLYIGTGNFSQTNYPFVDPSTSIQANQTFASDGGRVFFTSTDQDGNFNVGNLFGVQQSTGTATLNASAFNLSGLQSLQLGTVSVGAGSAVITSFSTDPYFTANSDNILPTQRAIKSYITAQIGGGQSSLNVNTLTSGVIYVANNTISTTSGVQINVRSKMYFTAGIDGAPVALSFFLQN